MIPGMKPALATTRQPIQVYKHCFVCLYLCRAASTTSGELRSAWCRTRSSIVSLFLSVTVTPAALKSVTMTVTSSAGLPPTYTQCLHLVGIQHTQTALRARASGSPFTPSSPRSSSRITKSLDMSCSSLKRLARCVSQQRTH